MKSEKTKAIAAIKAGMDEKTARKYVKLGKLPSEVRKNHNWQTRQDPFEADWKLIKELLEANPGLEKPKQSLSIYSVRSRENSMMGNYGRCKDG